MFLPVTMIAATLVLNAPRPDPRSPIKVLLISGQNNHNWEYTSRVHAETLEATGRFVVTITDKPQETLADAKALAQYPLFVLDYNDDKQPRAWGPAAEQNFVQAVKGGAGVVAIHAANNAFKGWADYEKMLGLLWRDGAGHGKFHEFKVEPTQPRHRIFSTMVGPDDEFSPFSTSDELYHGLSNPRSAQFKVIADAMSSKDSGGSGKREPMALVNEFGKGRVFATPLGHAWNGADATKVSVVNGGFRALLCRGAEWAATGEVTQWAFWRDERQHNALSTEETAAGWNLLFDGKTTAGWRGFKKDSFPERGWTVADGALTVNAQGGGGDIVTAEQFGDFEFACDWKVAKGGNSGIIYRATEDRTYPWETGLECQILDDAEHVDGKEPRTRAGTLYAIAPLAHDTARPAGEWNHARIVAKGNRIEHWLNGFKVVDIELGSEVYKAAHAQSKWTKVPDFGTRKSGHIALQDHGDKVQFRDIKIRSLK